MEQVEHIDLFSLGEGESRESFLRKQHLSEHPEGELARLEYGMRGRFQAEHPAEKWLV